MKGKEKAPELNLGAEVEVETETETLELVQVLALTLALKMVPVLTRFAEVQSLRIDAKVLLSAVFR